VQAPIIVTFRQPADARFDFDRFHDALAARGFVIYPGRLTAAPSFRVGCIGQVRADDILRFVAATREALAALGIRSLAPAP
jgi:2-aminoethylphosphonate-pyruvate transaminase